MKIIRLNLLLGLSFILINQVAAQTSHISVSDGGFENAGGFSGNGWTVVNHTVNQWVIGNSSAPAAGLNAAYISNNGIGYQYTNSVSQTSHFYRDVTVPASESYINLSFKIKSAAEPFFDRLLVYTAPTTFTPVVGDPASSSPTLPGATLVFTDPANDAGYSTYNILLSPSLAGSSFRLIFTWQNDASGTPNVPVSIDDISLISSAGGPLSGTYTIDPQLPPSASIPAAGSNFNSFASAIEYLQTFGKTSQVEFSVPAGSLHAEPLLTITASGAVGDSIIFKKSGIGPNPIITPAAGSSSADAAIRLLGADYVVFDGIDIVSDLTPPTIQANVEYAFHIRNASATDGASNCVIKNCTVTLSNNFNGSVGVYIQTSPAPSSAAGTNSFNLIENVNVERSFFGIRDLSNATNRNNGNVFRNCQLGVGANAEIGNSSLTSACIGLHLINSLNATVEGNVIQNVGTSGSTDGMYIQNASGTLNVSGNSVSGVRNFGVSSSASAHGMRVTLIDGAEARIFNNFIYDISHAYGTPVVSELVKGLSVQPLTNVSNATLYHVDFNSIQLDGAASPNVSTVCFEVGLAGPTVNVRNNIFSNITANQSGNPKHFCTVFPVLTIAAAGSSADYNNYYCPNTGNGFLSRVGSTDYSTLATWSAASGFDNNSFDVNPEFVSPTDLHVQSAILDSAASMVGISWITDDIDGELRSSFPDIGADEYSLVAFDISMVTLLQPTNGVGCFQNNQNVLVRIRNLAGQPHDFSTYPVFVQIDVSGAVTTQLLTQINDNTLVGGPLGSLQSIDYLAGTVDMTAYGDYTFRCKAFFPQDQNTANDSLSTPITITNAFPMTLPEMVDFTGYSGNDLSTVFPNWSEATGVLPSTGTSGWTSASGLGGGANVTARVRQNTTDEYNWLLSAKLTAAYNTLLSFDAAVCAPFSFAAGTFAPDDQLQVLVSDDCGVSYNVIHVIDATYNWSNALSNVVLQLGQFAGQDIIVGIRAYSGATLDGDYDLHLDNIMIFNSNLLDLEVASLSKPLQSNCYGTSEDVELMIINKGFTNVDFQVTPLTINCSITGPANFTLSETLSTGSLGYGDTLFYTFQNGINLTLPGNYSFDYDFALSGGDAQPSNDFGISQRISQNPSLNLTASADTVCINTNAVVFSNASANGAGANTLAPFVYSGPSVSIPDADFNGIEVPLTINGVGGFASQLVSVVINNISHAFMGELRIEIIAPDGSSILLTEFNGGVGTGYVDTDFNMNATTPIQNGSSPFTGAYLPQESFLNLTGNANGVWKLKVIDVASGDLGSVNSWSLIFKEPNQIVSHAWQSPLTLVHSDVDSATVTVDQTANVAIQIFDSFGCAVSDSIQVSIPPEVEFNLSNDTLCGPQLVLLSGGSPSGGVYSGAGISNNELNTSTAGEGVYPLQYTWTSPQGCVDSADATVAISLLQAQISQQSDVSCFGSADGSVEFTVSGVLGQPSYSWTDATLAPAPSANNLSAGTYTLIVSDSICTIQESAVVSQPLPYNVSANITDEMMGSDGAINLIVNGATAPYSFNWLNGETTQSIANLTAGVYDVTITDANGCDTTLQVTVGSQVGIGGFEAGSSMKIYPNPTNDFVIITSDFESFDALDVYDATGRKVESFTKLAAPFRLSMAHYANGMYTFVVRRADITWRLKVQVTK